MSFLTYKASACVKNYLRPKIADLDQFQRSIGQERYQKVKDAVFYALEENTSVKRNVARDYLWEVGISPFAIRRMEFDVTFEQFDSDNLVHAMAYYTVRVTGPRNSLEKILGGLEERYGPTGLVDGLYSEIRDS